MTQKHIILAVYPKEAYKAVFNHIKLDSVSDNTSKIIVLGFLLL